MKHALRLTALGAAVLTVGLWAASGQASQHIVGSAHDFTALAGGTSPTSWNSGQICMPCHTPHNTTTVMTDGTPVPAPLWGHTITNINQTYTLYGGTTTGNITSQVDATSILCLSCHDGTVALSSYQNSTATDTTSTMATLYPSASIGTDLSHMHPIGMAAEYSNTSTTSSSWQPMTTGSHGGMAVGSLSLQSLNGQNVVGCSTCHSPHGTAYPAMLNAPLVGTFTVPNGYTVPGSGLCLNCHIK
jgi:hypothetical protein